MNDQTQKLRAIRRLLGSFAERRGPAGETVEQRAERMALVTHGYLTAIDGFDVGLVDAGVDLVLKGELPGHDMSFAPTAPMLATACRIAAERVARQRYLAGITAPRLPAPEIVHTDEQRAKAKAQVQAFIESVAAADIHETTEEAKRRKERWEKVNARFQPAMDDASIMERLLGYSVGSPESEGEAA